MKALKNNTFSHTALGIYAVTILFYAVIYMVLMVLPFQAITKGADHTVIGMIMGITMLSSMLTRPWAGRWVDKYGSNKVFLGALALFACSLLGYFFDTLWMFWCVRLLQGIVAAAFSTAMEIITIELFSKQQRAQGLSLYTLATVIPTTFGPALSLYLMNAWSLQAIFLLFFILGIVNLGCGLLLAQRTKGIAQQTKSNQAGRLVYFIQQPLLLIPALLMLVVSIANGTVFTFLPLYLQSLTSPYASWYFLIQMSSLVVARFVGRRFLASDGQLPLKQIVVLSLSICLGMSLLYYSDHFLSLGLAAILNGLGFALLYPLLLTFVSFQVENASRGYYLGLFIGAADLGFALGALLMGCLADILSLKALFLSSALLVLMNLLLCVWFKRVKL